MTRNDQDYVVLTPEDRQRQDNLRKISRISFWGSISAKDYVKTLKEVVPMFWNEEEVKNLVQNNCVNKTNLHKALAKYLRKIVDISDGKLNFDDYKAYTNGVSLEHMDDKFEQLSFFLKMENTNQQAISSRTSQAKGNA